MYLNLFEYSYTKELSGDAGDRTTELHPLFRITGQIVKESKKWAEKQCVPTGGLEPPIFGLGDRRLIH